MNVAGILRIGLGLMYLWAFIAQGFGIGYTNSNGTDRGWYFSFDTANGWITSGFDHSPTAGYVSGMTGPIGSFVQWLPNGLVDFLWLFALAGLGIALTFGIFMTIAGWGGFVLNMLIWIGGLPPSSNPIIDGEHMAFALSILLLMFLKADTRFGFGSWWRAHTPRLLN